MASHNEYPGYVALPKKLPPKTPRKPARKSLKEVLEKVPDGTVRLDFNYRIVGDSRKSKLLGFSLRLFTPQFFKERHGRTEIGVHLRPEEWLDLIDAMKKEYDSAVQGMKEFDEP